MIDNGWILEYVLLSHVSPWQLCSSISLYCHSTYLLYQFNRLQLKLMGASSARHKEETVYYKTVTTVKPKKKKVCYVSLVCQAFLQQLHWRLFHSCRKVWQNKQSKTKKNPKVEKSKSLFVLWMSFNLWWHFCMSTSTVKLYIVRQNLLVQKSFIFLIFLLIFRFKNCKTEINRGINGIFV